MEVKVEVIELFRGKEQEDCSTFDYLLSTLSTDSKLYTLNSKLDNVQ